jgi:hypothetical protein
MDGPHFSSVDEAFVNLRYDVWRWIIDANNGVNGDVGDLMMIMDASDAPCPDSLSEA